MQYPYKVIIGRLTTLHRSLTAAKKKAAKKGIVFEHNPFERKLLDHSDELGYWVKIQ